MFQLDARYQERTKPLLDIRRSEYPFALAIEDCLGAKEGNTWTKALLKAIGELSNVAGGHARAYFEMAPRSVVARLSPSLVAGFDTYGFDDQGKFAELARIQKDDLPGREFWIGGEIVRGMSDADKTRLKSEGVRLFDNPQRLLEVISAVAFGET